MRTMLRGKVTLLIMMLGMLIAIPAVALAAELVVNAELNSTTVSSVTVKQGETANFDIKVSATGVVACGTTHSATVAKDFSLDDQANLSVGAFSGALNFPGGSGTSTNCPITGGPYTVAGSISADQNTPVGTYTDKIVWSEAQNTTTTTDQNTVNGKLDDKTATNLTVVVVAGTPANSAPEVATAAADANGDEGDTLQTNGAFSDADGNNTLTITKQSGAGDVVDNGNGTWSWSLATNDNGNGTVIVKASDGTDTVTDTFDWSAANVAPTVTNIAASAQNALSGKDVTFTGTATDVSSVDQAAGFFWKWSEDGGTFGSYGAQAANTFTASFSSCGSHHVSAVAKDKDNGESAAVDSGSVNVYNASFSPPVDAAPYINTVQKGRVIPVKISVSCNGNIANLSPSIQLLTGDKTDGSETTADEIETYSVSAADTGQVMRTIDGGYIYNLRVPDVANAYYTIRANPFGGSNASSNMYALLKTRK
jgi:hypothetical protein